MAVFFSPLSLHHCPLLCALSPLLVLPFLASRPFCPFSHFGPVRHSCHLSCPLPHCFSAPGTLSLCASLQFLPSWPLSFCSAHFLFPLMCASLCHFCLWYSRSTLFTALVSLAHVCHSANIPTHMRWLKCPQTSVNRTLTICMEAVPALDVFYEIDGRKSRHIKAVLGLVSRRDAGDLRINELY